MLQILTTLVGLTGLTTCLSSPFAYTERAQLEQVVKLSGLNFPTQFNKFSDYLDLPDSTKHIHYWYLESYTELET